MVDTLGLLLVVVVYCANQYDSKGAMKVFEKLNENFYTITKISAYGGYRGELIEKVRIQFKFLLEIILRPSDSEKFKILLKRWIVEKTFSWFESYRRLGKDYEYHKNIAEAMV